MLSMKKSALSILSFMTFSIPSLNVSMVQTTLIPHSPGSKRSFFVLTTWFPQTSMLLTSFPTVWDSMFRLNHPASFPSAPYHCPYFGWDHSSPTEGTAWQHVAMTHTRKEAICPFCARATSLANRNNFIRYTNPAALHQHVMFIHVIQPHTSSL